ncbi:MAG TPA: hypothetical protein PKE57_00125 [Cellvibrionaceae bacterium]|nr:hypothetical protein [Cellvibrionaceae bacterium]HMW48669.1 hypothetical protein [Cellvibrionaceae bacterium]HMW70307.1 hypothetical protein [Cellvibrionaceae bacterium]HMY38447.1 hypothetical protein [Marinagarivorans sp.]HNG59140.1 hypothetical protein [Cellvibrionaceae bacterium]
MQSLLGRWLGLLCLALAAYCFMQVGQGLMAGEITKLSKYSQEIIQRAAQPERFWIAIGFWTIGATILLVTGIKKITRRD